MDNQSYIKMSNSLKYIALYWNLGFLEKEHDIFVKKYDDFDVVINAEKQTINFNNRIKNLGPQFCLDSHKSFVVLELLNRLLNLGYSANAIILNPSKEYDLEVDKLKIKCFPWGELEVPKQADDCSNINVYYESRLVSGCIETKYYADYKKKRFNSGIFKICNVFDFICMKNEIENDDKDFVIESTKLVKYIGQSSKVIVPNGITELGPSVFWDNQFIEEVILPEGLINYGGDTFYNCKKLKKVNIPSTVETMGDNPFAGCPKLNLINYSPNFIYENDALYNKNKNVLIYFNLSSHLSEFIIPDTVTIIGKHSFYMSKLKQVTIPQSVYRLANNPFSDSCNLRIINYSPRYKVIDGVIYTADLTTVVGALSSISTDCLKLENVKVIARNAFYNCAGIKKIILPKTLEQIGYNPFVGCTNIAFESNSKNYPVIEGVLYTNNLEKLVCFPRSLAHGQVDLLDSVIELERGAFSGCDLMDNIKLHNVSVIGKSCFTNCKCLQEIYLSDLVSYVGEWAFAHCSNLKIFSCYKDCYLDERIFANTNCKIEIRQSRSNYLFESENLYTLKSMLLGYKNKIDSICIDPPYNSNIDYIGYKDGNYEDGYFNFIEERVRLSYELLSDKGFLIINIDEGEVKELEDLCKTIFDKELVSVHRWKKKHPYFDANRVVLNPNKKQTDYEFIIVCRKTHEAILNDVKQPFITNGILKESYQPFPTCFDCFGTTSSAKDEINELFGSRDYFSTPKPVNLIKEFVRATTNKKSIVLDFFAGSGTTGHAVEELNLDDGGNRNYILVSNSESNICKKVTKKRLDLIHSNYYFMD